MPIVVELSSHCFSFRCSRTALDIPAFLPEAGTRLKWIIFPSQSEAGPENSWQRHWEKQELGYGPETAEGLKRGVINVCQGFERTDWSRRKQ